MGLTPLIQETYDEKLQTIEELLKPGTEITDEKLRKASSDSLPVTRGVIAALRDERDQKVLAQRLASEVALSEVLGQALLLTRLLNSGAREPNVAANALAVSAVERQTAVLQKEIDNLKMELDLRRELSKNSPLAIVERGQSRTENSRSVLPAAPETDRLQQLQKSSAKE